MVREVWSGIEQFLPRRNRRIALLAGVSLCAGVFEAAVLVIIARAAVTVSDGGGRSLDLPLLGDGTSVGWALAVGAVLAILTLAAHFAVSALTARMSTDTVKRAQSAMTAAFLHADLETQRSDREGSLQEVMTVAIPAVGVLVLNVGVCVTALISVIALLCVALVVDPAVALVTVAAGVGLFAVVRPLARRTQRAGRGATASNALVAEEVAELSSLAAEAKAFRVADAMQQHVDSVTTSSTAATRRVGFLRSLGSYLYRDLALLCLVGATVAAYSVSGSELGAFGSVVLLVVRALANAQQANGGYHVVAENAAALDRVTAQLRRYRDRAEPSGTKDVERMEVLRVEDLRFEYRPGAPVLRGIELELDAREMVGIVGPSGSGKSTLLQMLLRLRPPTSGSVLVNGEPADAFTTTSWARRLSFVPQDPVFWDGTVTENVRFHREWIPDDAITWAIDAAHLTDVVAALPDGAATRLGPRGASLSGGQRQRLAIARALAGRPDFLLLDEPTSALDAESEGHIQSTLSELRGRVGLVIVAHRLSTVSTCDRIVVVVDGSIEASGPPADVLAESRFYRIAHELLGAIDRLDVGR